MTSTISSFGVQAWVGLPSLMPSAHQHDDLEINFVAEGGSMVYLFGGEPVEVGPGDLAVFWAALPHQVVASSVSKGFWVHVPFGTFLGWGLPEAATGRLLSGPPLISTRHALADRATFDRWVADFDSRNPERARIAMLEIEAQIRRVFLVVPPDPALSRTAPLRAGTDATLRQAASMAKHIAEEFREPLTVADVARAAQLHPNYAMTQFRKVTGMTLGDHLLRCRLAEARRLLVTTGLPVSRVATDSGFGSVSRFYSAFTAECGVPPAMFRREYRATVPRPAAP
ncbi:helix-turn-helix domain-containing protein [Pseudonocardia sp. TRM90224]|uniref:helix-turn-helix domain-containing protein n=1 Tax=Pseudonocardia sp. TRM90224 TaxID=2812678 RepID=UPI001E653DE7|nr:helix-turn-helix domain-containing protein [Pseudonocardia sp. TRM90224]